MAKHSRRFVETFDGIVGYDLVWTDIAMQMQFNYHHQAYTSPLAAGMMHGMNQYIPIYSEH
jgi:hypothetical protein